MGHEFDRGVEVTRTEAGAYDAQLDPGWVVGGGVNGGYLLAVLGSAVRQELAGKPDPLTFAVNYVSPARPGPARITTRVVREGRGTATVAAEMSQDGALRLTGLATYGDLAGLPDEVRTTAEEPQLPPVEECLSAGLAPEGFRAVAPLLERLDMRLDPACAGWVVGEPSGAGMIQAWFRFADGREPDPLALLFAVDALPPVSFDLGLKGWAPTIELTAHIRAIPAPGWLRLRHTTRNVAGGLFEEDCEVWDAAGRLVAQSRQLAKLPR